MPQTHQRRHCHQRICGSASEQGRCSSSTPAMGYQHDRTPRHLRPASQGSAVQEELAWTALQVAAEQARARKQAERVEAKERKKKEKLRKTRGDAWIVELCADDDEDGTPDLSSDVACLAVNCDGYFYINDDGTNWYNGIPDGLHRRLGGRQKHLPLPVYVSMGQNEQDYIKFADGKYWYDSDDPEFAAALSDFNEVECVAFGPTDNSWVIIGDGGHCDYGDEIPSELMIQLDENDGSLKFVSLGPDHEWFVRYPDSYDIDYAGYENWDKYQELDEALDEINSHMYRVDRGNSLVREVHFGDECGYVVRHVSY